MKKLNYGIIKDELILFFIEWSFFRITFCYGYQGLSIGIQPKLFHRDFISGKRIFKPGLFIDIALMWAGIFIAVEQRKKHCLPAQGKFQVANFLYHGHSYQQLPGFLDWEISAVIGWSTSPGIVEVMDTEAKRHLVPVCCLSPELAKELPPARS